MISTIRFLHPEVAYGFIAIIFLWVLGGGYLYYKKKKLEQFATLASLQVLAPPFSLSNIILKSGLLSAGLALCVLAGMDPIGNERPLDRQEDTEEAQYTFTPEIGATERQNVQQEAHDVIFLIDASASMAAEDTRTKISRLKLAKDIVAETISLLDGQTIAIYTFTSELTKVVPLTLDYLYARLLLKQVDINYGDAAGTDYMEVLARLRSEELIVHPSKKKTVILLSDGGDTQLEEAEEGTKKKEAAPILKQVGSADQYHFIFDCIGIGSKEGTTIPGIVYEKKAVTSKLEPFLLEKIAEVTGGSFYMAADYSPLRLAEMLAKKIKQDPFLIEENKEVEVGSAQKLSLEKPASPTIFDRYFQYYLGVGILFLVLGMKVPLYSWSWESRKDAR